MDIDSDLLDQYYDETSEHDRENGYNFEQWVEDNQIGE